METEIYCKRKVSMKGETVFSNGKTYKADSEDGSDWKTKDDLKQTHWVGKIDGSDKWFNRHFNVVPKKHNHNDRLLNKPILLKAIKYNYPKFTDDEVSSYYAEFFGWNCVAQIALTMLRNQLELTPEKK